MGDDICISSVVHRGLANCFGGKRKSTGFDHVQLRIEADGQSHQRPKVLGNVRLVGGDMWQNQKMKSAAVKSSASESSTVMRIFVYRIRVLSPTWLMIRSSKVAPSMSIRS